MALLTFVVVFVAFGGAVGIAVGWPWFVWLPFGLLAGLVTGSIAYQAWRSGQGN